MSYKQKAKREPVTAKINVQIQTPVAPSETLAANLRDEIWKAIGECSVLFFADRIHEFNVTVFDHNLTQMPELRDKVVDTYFTFLYQNH